MNSVTLPTNDLAFGRYPQRPVAPIDAGIQRLLNRWRSGTPGAGKFSRIPAKTLEYMCRAQVQAAELAPQALTFKAKRLGQRLRTNGLSEAAGGAILGYAAEALSRHLKLRPYDTQLNAAWQMLQGHLVEMQTGEGKTLAAALAAAAAALTGSTVYVLTANDYLVRRDHDLLAGFFASLGLSSGWVDIESSAQERRRGWRRQIVFSTARELAFDYLRDHVRLAGQRDPLKARTRALELESVGMDRVADAADCALIPGLCFCIVDEADSLLLDEAVVPLIIASPVGQDQDREVRLVYEIATGLIERDHYQVVKSRRRVLLTDSGREQVRFRVQSDPGLLAVERRAFEWVQTALAAQYLYQANRDYALVGEQIILIDELTGRLAHGRQWQGVLHAMVELKHGLKPTQPSQINAQITYQALFPRVMHLCGMSGTLGDNRRELYALYGRQVVQVPLRGVSRRRDEGMRVLETATLKWAAVVAKVKAIQQSGRPVLVGTDSVADSAHLSDLLDAAGVRHQILNATQSAAEAASLARAGRSSVVTVTTNIAGRGTDIRLSEAARRAGGLHVIATMRNRSRRVDRQLIGRSARQGDPGSFEVIVSCEDKLFVNNLPPGFQAFCRMLCSKSDVRFQWLLKLPFVLAQRLEELKDRTTRRALRDADTTRQSQFGFAGLSE